MRSPLYFVILAVPALCFTALKRRAPYDTLALRPVKPIYSDLEVARLLQNAGNENIPILQRQNTNTSAPNSTNTTTASSSHHTGGLSLARQFDNEKIIDLDLHQGHNKDNLIVSILCISCYTTGSGSVIVPALQSKSSKAVQILEDIGEGILALIDPIAAIEVAVSGGVNVTLSNFSAHFEFDIALAAYGVYEFTVFKIPVPMVGIGAEVDNFGVLAGVDFGLSFVFSVNASLNFTTGFDITFPNDAFLAMDLFRGELMHTNFGDVQFSPIPVHVIEGEGTFSISLRATIAAGVSIDLGPVGLDVDAGLEVDLPNYKASVVYNTSAQCALDFEEVIAIDAGAFAGATARDAWKDESVAVAKTTAFISHTLEGTCIATKLSRWATTISHASSKSSSTTKTVTVTSSSPTSGISSPPASNYSTPFPTNPQVVLTNAITLATLATPVVAKVNTAVTPISGSSSGNVTSLVSTAITSSTAVQNATLSSLLSSLQALAPSSSAYIVATTVSLATFSSTGAPTSTQGAKKKSSAVAWNTPPILCVYSFLFTSLLFFCLV